MVLAKFRRLEFEAVDGVIRTFYGCSVVGAIEFDERLAELHHEIASKSTDTTAEQLYREDKWVRHLVDRLLLLNGIKPEWCNWEMVSQFVFGRLGDDGKVTEGYLVTLNRPEKAQATSKKGESVTGKAALIAAISTHCGGIEEAYRIAETVPAQELFQVLEQKVNLSKSPEERAKEQDEKGYSDWKQKKLEQINSRRLAS